MVAKWTQEDSILYLDTIEVRVIQVFEKQRIAYYEELLEKIRNVTILDSGPEYEHSFCNDCYQNEVKVITKRYKEENSNPTVIVYPNNLKNREIPDSSGCLGISVNLMDYATVQEV
jgi:hypothetical protein